MARLFFYVVGVLAARCSRSPSPRPPSPLPQRQHMSVPLVSPVGLSQEMEKQINKPWRNLYWEQRVALPVREKLRNTHTGYERAALAAAQSPNLFRLVSGSFIAFAMDTIGTPKIAPSFPSTLRPFSPFPSPPHLRPHTTQRCYLRGTRDDVLRLFQFAQSERPRPVPGRPPAAPAVGNPLSVDRNGVLLPGRRVSCVFFEGGLFNVVAECGVSFVASGERHHASS